MGIKKLLPFLKSKGALKAFTGFVPGTKVAIDVPIFAHKFIYVERTYEGLVRRFHKFADDLKLQHVEPVFVFDGHEKLDLKNDERQKRAVARDKQLDRCNAQASKLIEELSQANIEITISTSFSGIMFPTKYEYGMLRESLTSAGHETMQARYEAEALCAHLNATDKVALVMTEDTDAVAFGAKRVLFKWSSEEQLEYDQEHALKALNLTMEQLVDLCCLFGCDFCDNVFNVGPVGAYDLLVKHGSWASIYDMKKYAWPTKTSESADVFDSKYQKVKACFLTRASEVVPECPMEASVEANETTEDYASKHIEDCESVKE